MEKQAKFKVITQECQTGLKRHTMCMDNATSKVLVNHCNIILWFDWGGSQEHHDKELDALKAVLSTAAELHGLEATFEQQTLGKREDMFNGR